MSISRKLLPIAVNFTLKDHTYDLRLDDKYGDEMSNEANTAEALEIIKKKAAQ